MSFLWKGLAESWDALSNIFSNYLETERHKAQKISTNL
jgi:hypothetical protein